MELPSVGTIGKYVGTRQEGLEGGTGRDGDGYGGRRFPSEQRSDSVYVVALRRPPGVTDGSVRVFFPTFGSA